MIETETEDEKVAAAGPTGLEIGRDETAEAEAGAETETETEETAIEIRKGKEEAGVIHPAAAEVEAESGTLVATFAMHMTCMLAPYGAQCGSFSAAPCVNKGILKIYINHLVFPSAPLF